MQILETEDCTNELNCLKIVTNKNDDQKLVKFHNFPDSAHQVQLEQAQGYFQIDKKLPYHGAHGQLTDEIHNKNWKPHIGIDNLSNCTAEMQNSRYQEILFFNWNQQKVQPTRDLRDDTIIYQGTRLPCKKDQGFAIPLHKHRQPYYDFPKTHVQQSKLLIFRLQ